MTKRYYEFEAESDYGSGTGFFEFDERWVSRQIELYRDKVLWAEVTSDSGLWPDRITASEPNAGICDQPFDVLAMNDEDEILQARFEEKWNEAKRLTGNKVT